MKKGENMNMSGVCAETRGAGSTAAVLDSSHDENQICAGNTSTPCRRERLLHPHARYADAKRAGFSLSHQQSAGPERESVF